MDIEIRMAEPSDAKSLKEIYECPQVYSNTLQLPLPSAAMWEKRFSHIPEHVFPYVAILGGEIVGNLGFELCTNLRRRHVGTFVMGVKDKVQGQGIGSALLRAMIDLADNWLDVKRVELTVYVDNHSAIHLYKKFGFEIEGESKAYAFRQGEYVDAYHMARVK